MGLDFDAAVVLAALGGVGAFLKWATLPCLMAYELGRRVERIRNGSQAPAWRRVPVSPEVARAVGSGSRPGRAWR